MIAIGETSRATALCEDCPAHRRTDPLTGLDDRQAFLSRLDAALAFGRANPGDRSGPNPVVRSGQGSGQGSGHVSGPALLLIDLDRFKAVNDALGHPAGDLLLRAAGRRLRGALRGSDTAARLGGDEFAILLANPEPGAPELVGGRIVDLLSRPYMLDGQVATVGASVGGALAPIDASESGPLLSRADLALYQAKREGRGRARMFAPDMQARADYRRTLEQELRAALPLGQFALFYQPQLVAESGRLTSFEALLRWRHPERGIIPPDAFLPLAEEIGLITQIGEWVLRAACAEAATWPVDIAVAVNVAAQQFESGRLVAAVAAALSAANLAPRRLELEITESALLGPEDGRALEQLNLLKALGVRISLDDFGTGYSSLTQLRSFAFDRVKIDRTFANDAAVVRAIASLGASLGMRTTAEGVETAEQLARIRADGCTEVQGYLIGKPVPAAELAGVIAALAPPTETSA